ncbi:MAG: PH domain-containing protein [Candidatus Daviesbacteria bacterium]|nr:PH domain-containing protein [Candidatus Daviesbacteria bacterium]
MFSAYIERPSNCRFEGQDPNEKILLLLRAHPITNLSWIALSIFIFFIPFAVFKIVPLIGFDLALFPETYQLAGIIINYLFVLIVVFEGFLNWYFNVSIVTNEKIIDMEFEYLLYKAVDLAPLPKIEETDSVTAGILGTLFNFGNVKVQTAGATVAIEMHNIPHPATVADIILDLIGKPYTRVVPE